MGIASRTWRRLLARVPAGLAVPLVVPLAWAGQLPAAPPAPAPANRALVAQETRPEASAPATSPQAPGNAAAAPTLGLSECIGIALDRQPAIAAQRASLAAASSGYRDLQNSRIPEFIVRSLPYRRQQAGLGVAAASAALDQVERETVYAVTRTYFTVLFAREQLRVADRIVRDLRDSLENAERLLQTGAIKDLTQNAVDRNRIYLRLAQGRRTDAEQGIERATAAMREAMGVPPDFCFALPTGPLPDIRREVCREEVVSLALSRRGEMVQATSAAEVAALEVQAQGASCGARKQTFAAFADIHSRPIPEGVSDTEYRPGAVGPEMPAYLAGSRSGRVERAEDFSGRAGAVVDKTRNLITLEAENAYYQWRTASLKLPLFREAADRADKTAADTLADFKGGLAVSYRDVLETLVLAAQARIQLNEARYQYLLALAALERITAGGFRAHFEETRNQP